MPQNHDLIAYRAMVLDAMEQATKQGRTVVFGNTGPAHAAIVLDVMLANATKSVDIVSGFLDRSVWSVDSINKLVTNSPDVRIRILLDEIVDDRIPLVSVLSILPRNKKIIAKRLRKPLGVHLCNVDNIHVRLESLQGTYEASVTFGDSQNTGPSTARTFDALWESLELEPALEETEASQQPAA